MCNTIRSRQPQNRVQRKKSAVVETSGAGREIRRSSTFLASINELLPMHPFKTGDTLQLWRILQVGTKVRLKREGKTTRYSDLSLAKEHMATTIAQTTAWFDRKFKSANSSISTEISVKSQETDLKPYLKAVRAFKLTEITR